MPAPGSPLSPAARQKIPPAQPTARRKTPAHKPRSEPPMTNARGLFFGPLIFALHILQSRRLVLRHLGCRSRIFWQVMSAGLQEKFPPVARQTTTLLR